MADKITDTLSLKLELLFVDGDTRTINLSNPKTNIKASDIQALETLIKENNLLIGDKYGGDFKLISKATRVRKYVTTLDIS